MTRRRDVIGWDVGGAHLKLAHIDRRGTLRHVAQHPCPLWRGVDRLEALLRRLGARFDLAQCRHAVTMTGELADVFPDRLTGVHELIERFMHHAAGAPVRFYSARAGLVSPAQARRHALDVASANWHATASVAARHHRDALLADIGSTTTDLIRIGAGKVRARGATDAERLRSGELLYTGVVRTPVMATVRKVPFAGEWQMLAAEHFATLADAYQLTGHLDPRHNRMPTADGAGKAPHDCARRLARMLGRDVREADLDGWRQVAGYIARVHEDGVRRGVERVLSAGGTDCDLTVIGAGVGRFIARSIAARLQYPYTDFAQLLDTPARLRDITAVCAPAVAVAKLALD